MLAALEGAHQLSDTPETPSEPSIPSSSVPTPPVPLTEQEKAEQAAAARARAEQAAAPQPDAAQSTPVEQPAAAASVPPVDPTEPVTPVQPPVAAPVSSAAPTARKRSATVGIVAALAVGAIVGGVSGAGVALLATNNNNSNGNQSTALDPTAINVNDPDDATTVTAVAAKATPSVVTISVATNNEGGTGSGVILTDDGYILTNTHVVTLDGASADGEVKVTFSDGRIMDATVVGTDPVSDLAVIKVKATGLTPAKFADSSALNVGDTAIAIGAPLGLSGTVTDGIVSSLNRSITIASSAVPEEQSTEQGDSGKNPFDLWGFDLPGQSTTNKSSSTISIAVIQTDAAINPGNSGGALLNSEAEVIGINVAIASAGSTSGSSAQSGSIGVGFAIPANLAKRVADEIIAGGSASHGLLGASIVNDTTTSATDKDVVGAEISDVSPGGAAEGAGLKAGDIITSFNGLPITDYTDLIAQVRALAAGATAPIGYVRDGSSQTASVTLGKLE